MSKEIKIGNLIKEVKGFKDMDRDDQITFHKFIIDNDLNFYVNESAQSHKRHKGWGHYSYSTTYVIDFYFKTKDGKFINVDKNNLPSAYYSEDATYKKLSTWRSARNAQPVISKEVTNYLMDGYKFFLENINYDYSEFDI